MGYFRRIGSIMSQTVNVIVLLGHPDESISARSYRMSGSSKRWLFFRRNVVDKLFGNGHCEEAFKTDIRHAKELLELNDVHNYFGRG